tara:strand:+ start:239 stop:691 length:453 start_codon:yes stop_codon:yes gene_type:complete
MSTVVLDTITGKSTATTITIGSTPVVSASANSMTIRGEGSAQTSIQQGLAKAFVNFNGEGTIASRDSFNVGSLTDNGTGSYNINFSSNLGNGVYTTTGTAGDTNAAGAYVCQPHDSLAPSTSVCRVTITQAHATVTDEPYIGVVIHGDLA